MKKWDELTWWKRTVKQLLDDMEEEINIKRARFSEIEKEELPYYRERLKELEEGTPFKITKIRNMALFLQGLYNEITGEEEEQ